MRCANTDYLPNSGATEIGKRTVTRLLRCNARVYVASRSHRKFDEVVDIVASIDTKMVEQLNFLELDLSDMKSCVSSAKTFTKLEERLDIIIANAALSIVVSCIASNLASKLSIQELIAMLRRPSLTFCRRMVSIYSSQ